VIARGYGRRGKSPICFDLKKMGGGTHAPHEIKLKGERRYLWGGRGGAMLGGGGVLLNFTILEGLFICC